jgi:hypothetical protein
VEGTRQWLGPGPVALLENGWYSLTDHVQQQTYWLTHPRPMPPAPGPRSTVPAAVAGPQPAGGAPAATPTPGVTPLPPDLVIPTTWPQATDEGVWQPAGRQVGGQAAMARTFVLPDPQRPYARVDLVWINPLRARVHLVAGTQYPAIPSGLHGTGEVPLDVRPRLLAAFNGGFQRMAGQYGSVGFRIAGQWFTQPTPGLATLAMDASGRATLGAWGSEVPFVPAPFDLRQNLPPILDQGRISPHIDDGAYWGVTVNNTVRVWRSGLGQTADGALIYAAGTPLTARGLAEALQAAGAQRAMELDINSYWVTFNFYFPDGPAAAPVRGEKLLAAMTRPATRYLTPDTRDFFYLTAAG